MTDALSLAPIRPAAAVPVTLGAGLALCVSLMAAAPFAGRLLADLSQARAAPVASAAAHLPTTVAPFILQAISSQERERAVHCLTDAVYYEAAHEPADGQRAIAQVVLNRVRDRHFPTSICGVVYQGWERRTGCQFSFACDGSIRRRPADATTWTRLRTISEQALGGYVDKAVGTATHYHADYVKPAWIKTVSQTAEVGRHIFYSWRGARGAASTLTRAYAGGEFSVQESALLGLRPKLGRA